MKKISILYITFVLFLLMISSCNHDILDTKPLTEYSDEDVWTDEALAETYVNNLYDRLKWKWDWTSQRVDETRERAGEDDFNFNNMLITPDNLNYWWGDWSGTYKSIRECNVFLENIDDLSSSSSLIDGKTLKDRMTGEVTFLRAWYYQHLVSFFGGVPLITASYSLTDDFSIARNTYEDCMEFISDECDKAASLLPEMNTGDNIGRVTKGAALALKSRALLYAASDLHNTSMFSSYSNSELLEYQGGDRVARWQAAKKAAKTVIDMNVYSLYQPEPTSPAEASENYHQVFVLPQTSEDIFVRFFSASADKGVGMFEIYPNGWYGNGRTGAVNELVDAYEMNDGTKFSRENPEQNAEPYKNRDPRFYGTVIHEGALVASRTSDLADIDPDGVMQAGRWEVWNSETGSIDEVWGLDTRNGVANSWNSSLTSTGCKKFLNTDFPASAVWQSNADLTWRYIRYGEIILNYAEACIELGEDGEARQYLNMIRKRAGMPEITDIGEALKERYRNERRIELAFEDQRFFDVRRWVIGADAYHDMHGVDIVYELNSDNTTSTIPTITPVTIMTGSWDNKAYFMPFTRDETNKNSLLVQNPGYN